MTSSVTTSTPFEDPFPSGRWIARLAHGLRASPRSPPLLVRREVLRAQGRPGGLSSAETFEGAAGGGSPAAPAGRSHGLERMSLQRRPRSPSSTATVSNDRRGTPVHEKKCPRKGTGGQPHSTRARFFGAEYVPRARTIGLANFGVVVSPLAPCNSAKSAAASVHGRSLASTREPTIRTPHFRYPTILPVPDSDAYGARPAREPPLSESPGPLADEDCGPPA